MTEEVELRVRVRSVALEIVVKVLRHSAWGAVCPRRLQPAISDESRGSSGSPAFPSQRRSARA